MSGGGCGRTVVSKGAVGAFCAFDADAVVQVQLVFGRVGAAMYATPW